MKTPAPPASPSITGVNHFSRFSLITTTTLALAMVSLLRAAPSQRPNIVVLLADDLGYGDLSSYGCPDIQTPAIDEIGRRGVRFTQFYSNSAQCTPSRVALLTGRYQQRVGGLECAIGNGNVGRYDEAEWLQKRGELGLPATETTIAELLRRAGYETAIIGKWHLGYEPKFWPNNHGFQESFVALGGGLDYVTHTEQDGSHVLVHNGRRTRATGYITDVFADRAIEWISQRRGPYFLYVPFNAPHSPLQAPGDVALNGKWGGGTRDTYGRMIEHMDACIREIVAAVERSPGKDNTIVVFLSDNGGTDVGRNAPLRGKKSQIWEGGIRVPCVMSWPGRIPAGRPTDQVALNIDLAATLLAAAGVNPPEERRLDGVSLLDVLTGKRAAYPRTVYWRYKRAETRKKAVREGDMKFIIDDGKEELFDLARDPGETRNLVGADPERAATLRARIAAWEQDVVAPRLRDFRLVTTAGKSP